MRYVSIDILRALAISLMVLVHFMENLAGADWAPAGIAAPIFTFLVGVSYRLWLNSQEARGKTDEQISRVSIRRGLFLFVLGFAFNIFVWLPEDTFNWDVLTLIGTALLLLNLIRNLPLPIPLLLCVMAFVLGPTLRTLVDYSSYWTQGYFEGDLTLSDVFIGFLATGYFPLFPWILYPLAGFITGSLFFTNVPEDKAPTGFAALLGAGLLAIGLIGVLLHPTITVTATFLPGWTMFPPSMEYVAGSLGLSLLLFSLAHRWLDPYAQSLEQTRIGAFVTTFSKYSLSMYLFHHMVHLWPLWIYGSIMGAEPTEFWTKAMPVNVAVALSALCLLVGFFLFRWMERTDRPGIESWMRYICD